VVVEQVELVRLQELQLPVLNIPAVAAEALVAPHHQVLVALVLLLFAINKYLKKL
jgi:hypothetical protein|tara:strand:- start:33 stop:197 length:165 start_codon:yes stop_codon:yes gene_type:complete